MAESQQQRPSFTQPEVKEFRKWFPNLARGYSRNLPRRFMKADGRGPLYRDMANFWIKDGALERVHPETKIVMEGAETALTIDHNGNNGSTLYNGQFPLAIKDNMQSIVVVTDRELWIYNQVQSSASPSPNRWVNVTPEYSTGTVAVTNGSAVVTGGGLVDWEHATNPVLHRIHPGHLFNTDVGGQSVPAVIKTLDSDTQLTLETNWTGTTGSARAYTIRRTFQDPVAVGWQTGLGTRDIFLEEHNGDLYIGGAVLSRRNTGVIKIVDFEDTGVDQGDVTVVCQGSDVIPGIERPQNHDGMIIVGMKLLDDGRIVLAIHQNPAIASYGSYMTNRLVFSSHTDHTVWNTAPGGFLDIVSIPGELTAMGKWGSSLTIHTPEKIAFAHLTGADDAPLEIEAAALTHVGCAAPRTLKTVPGGEMFLSHDWQVYLFDGSRCLAVGDDIRADLRAIGGDNRRQRPLQCFARVDRHMGQYQLFAPMNFEAGDYDRYTEIFTLQLDSGEWTKGRSPGLISAASDTVKTDVHDGWVNRRKGYCFYGRPSFDIDVAGSQAQLDILTLMSDDVDGAAGYSGLTEDLSGAGDSFVVFEDEDFGYPGIAKTISRIQVWFEDTSVGAPRFAGLQCTIKTASGISFTAVSKDVSYSFPGPTSPSVQAHIMDFIFSDLPDAMEAWTITLETGTYGVPLRMFHMMVHGQLLYPVETLNRVSVEL